VQIDEPRTVGNSKVASGRIEPSEGDVTRQALALARGKDRRADLGQSVLPRVAPSGDTVARDGAQ
jgi:hypothetical protein